MALSSKQKTMSMAELSMLAALVVVLQFLSTLIPPIGGVAITLTLVPVVIGAILFGVKGGLVLGFFFSLVVMVNCMTGLDAGGSILWNANPIFTAIICFVKGISAGILPALIYKCVPNKEEKPKRKFMATVFAAASAPIINTTIFVIGALVFFTDILYAWQSAYGSPNMTTYIIVGLAGINFLVELTINLILTPAIVRIVSVVNKRKKK